MLWHTVLNAQDHRLRTDSGSKVHDAWNTAKKEIIIPGHQGAPNVIRYTKVKGPMGAIIAMLGTIGWDPIAPGEWGDHAGDKFLYRGGTLTPLLNDLRERVSAILWAQASEHHNGAGLEHGADIDQLKKHVKYYEDKQMHPTAS